MRTDVISGPGAAGLRVPLPALKAGSLNIQLNSVRGKTRASRQRGGGGGLKSCQALPSSSSGHILICSIVNSVTNLHVNWKCHSRDVFSCFSFFFSSSLHSKDDT